MAKKKKFTLLTKDQETELQNMINGMLDLAADVVVEYDDLDLTELEALSGSVSNITQINENSPFLDGIFEGNSWKRVIKNMGDASKKTEDGDVDDSK